MNTFKTVMLSREDLQRALDSFDKESTFVYFGLEMDSINGDQILWVENGKFGNDRAYIRLNKPFKSEE